MIEAMLDTADKLELSPEREEVSGFFLFSNISFNITVGMIQSSPVPLNDWTNPSPVAFIAVILLVAFLTLVEAYGWLAKNRCAF